MLGPTFIDPDGEGVEYLRCNRCDHLRVAEYHHFLCARNGEGRQFGLRGPYPDRECPYLPVGPRERTAG